LRYAPAVREYRHSVHTGILRPREHQNNPTIYPCHATADQPHPKPLGPAEMVGKLLRFFVAGVFRYMRFLCCCNTKAQT
ncbi:MAG: hypothetical protein M3342_04820, partial [Bacteroidota bacterium]|nr:hypothetical protein [Bacteroidota bacterium]